MPHNDYRPYLQVDLRSLYRVTGLRVQGSSSYAYAYAVIVLYSEDGWTWRAYADDQSDNARQFEANHAPGNDIAHINFAKPFTVELLIAYFDILFFFIYLFYCTTFSSPHILLCYVHWWDKSKIEMRWWLYISLRQTAD